MITTFKGHKHLHFKNGCILSVFNGFGSYSENHFNHKVRNKLIIKTKTCEIAILRNNIFITNNILGNGEDVKGHVDKKELKTIIKKIRNYEGERKWINI